MLLCPCTYVLRTKNTILVSYKIFYSVDVNILAKDSALSRKGNYSRAKIWNIETDCATGIPVKNAASCYDNPEPEREIQSMTENAGTDNKLHVYEQ